MKTQLRSAITVAVFMLMCVGLAWVMTPTRKLSTAKPIDLEVAIPTEFGDWKLDRNAINGVVNPQQQAVLDSIYSQVLSRVYIHSSGRRVMLSIAYGADQSKDTQVHKPEVCYPAQGFELLNSNKVLVKTGYGSIPAMRLVTRLGGRFEPVTYWIRSGERIVRGAVEQNWARVEYGLRGLVPDGLLFRVSEVQTEAGKAFDLQDRFSSDLLNNLPLAERQFLIGIEVKKQQKDVSNN